MRGPESGQRFVGVAFPVSGFVASRYAAPLRSGRIIVEARSLMRVTLPVKRRSKGCCPPPPRLSRQKPSSGIERPIVLAVPRLIQVELFVKGSSPRRESIAPANSIAVCPVCRSWPGRETGPSHYCVVASPERVASCCSSTWPCAGPTGRLHGRRQQADHNAGGTPLSGPRG